MPENTDLAADDRKQHDQHGQHNPSHLFLVRLWAESDNEGDAVWCGKVQHVTRGRANQFRDWSTLIDILLAMLPNVGSVSKTGHSGKDGSRHLPGSPHLPVERQ